MRTSQKLRRRGEMKWDLPPEPIPAAERDANLGNTGEAIDYLMAEKGFRDATIHAPSSRWLALRGIAKAWLFRSGEMPIAFEEDLQHWLLPNGEIFTTSLHDQDVRGVYERQHGQPFPIDRPTGEQLGG